MANAAKCFVPVDDVLVEGGHTGFLLVHGLGGLPADFAYLTEGLAAAGYSVSCPLLFGHGGSRNLLAATRWQHWQQSVEEAHEELSRRCDLVIVAGMGVGALLALKLAADRPSDVHGVVLLAPTMWPDGWAMPWRSRLLRFVGSKWLANLFRMDARPPYGIKDADLRRALLDARRDDVRPGEDVFGRRGGVLVELKLLVNSVKPQLGLVTQHCLIFHPRFDDQSRLASSQFLQKRLGSIVDLVVLEDSFHHVTEDRQRDLVLERMTQLANDLPKLLEQRPRPAKATPNLPSELGPTPPIEPEN